MRSDIFAALLGSAIVCVAPAAAASPTTFTYQGHLAQDGDPAEGAYEFEIRLLNDSGVQIGLTQTASEIVTAGAFSMQLDFGNAAFDGTDRYLEISVRSVVDGGAYIALSPNQLVTSAPVAQFALSGNEGPQGAQGLDGPQGSQGNPGADGDDGAPGDQGIQGEQGLPGGDGAPGVQGTQGDPGIPGDSHWEISGSETYYTIGDVGIGTSTPEYALTVESAAHADPAIYATISGANSIGVYGVASRSNSSTYGVRGESSSSTGTGVFGVAVSASGTNYGVRGSTNSSSGYAGYFTGGRNYFEGYVGFGTDFPIYPLHVDTSATTAAFFRSSNSSSTTYAVRGESESTNGRGVYGRANAATGSTYGVYGRSDSVVGRGVYGHASADSGSNYGVYGRTESSSGTGVYGYASSSDAGGNSAAIHGLVISDSGYAGYFAGGKSYFEGRVGLGTTAPTDQLHINAPDGEDAFRVQTAGLTRIRVNANGGVSLGANSTIIGAGDVYIAGNLGIGTNAPTFDLSVSGTAAKSGGGSWAVFSDQRLKKNITSMTGSLDVISALRPVNFEYKSEDHFSYLAGVQRGFIAQEVAKVIPQWVNTADDGFFYLDQVGYEALIVDAIQELRAEKDAEIEKIQIRTDRIQAENDLLKARLDRLERLMALSVDR